MVFSLIHFARSVAFSFSTVVFSVCSQKVILFHLPIGFVRNNINNHRNNHFLHHAYFTFLYLFWPKRKQTNTCHLPIQNKIALSKHVIQNRSLQKREKTHIAHITKLTKTHVNCLKSYRTHIRIYVSRASHVDVCMWAYAVRIRNMFRLEVNRAKVLTFNTSPNRHPFTIPSA